MKSKDILSKLRGGEKKDQADLKKDVQFAEGRQKETDKVRSNRKEAPADESRSSFREKISSQSAEVREMINYVIEPEERTLKNYFNFGFWQEKRQLYRKLKEKEKQDLNVYQVLSFGASPTIEYYVLTVLSCIIATVGLIQNSVAVIIGAMIIAPLMTPILAFSLGTIWGDLDLMKISLSSIFKGALLAIIISAAIAYGVPLKGYSAEILARTKPSLFDIIVAITSGVVGAYGYANKKISNTLVGIAIAVALMPPLCTIGIGVGTLNRDVAFGATLLFLINLVSISLAGAVIFWGMKIHPILASEGVAKRALYQIVLSILILGGIAIPIGFYMYEGYIMADVQKTAKDVVTRECGDVLVLNMKTEKTREGYVVTMTLSGDHEPDDRKIKTLGMLIKQQTPTVSSIKLRYVKSVLILN